VTIGALWVGRAELLSGPVGDKSGLKGRDHAFDRAGQRLHTCRVRSAVGDTTITQSAKNLTRSGCPRSHKRSGRADVWLPLPVSSPLWPFKDPIVPDTRVSPLSYVTQGRPCGYHFTLCDPR
jgi:hypothetical protein